MDEQENISDRCTEEAAKEIGIKYPVRVSPELASVLKPNAFMGGLGIHYQGRLKAVLRILKGSFIAEKPGAAETLPNKGCIIPFVVANGPYIREEPLSIKASLADGGGRTEILLSALPEKE